MYPSLAMATQLVACNPNPFCATKPTGGASQGPPSLRNQEDLVLVQLEQVEHWKAFPMGQPYHLAKVQVAKLLLAVELNLVQLEEVHLEEGLPIA